MTTVLQEFSRGKIFGKDKVKQEMMNWQKSAIHTSITRIDPLLAKDKDAITVFKNLLGYMGDKPLNYPQMLAREVLQKGIESDILRDEIYLQLIKQLTNNPSRYLLWLKCRPSSILTCFLVLFFVFCLFFK